MSSVLSGSSMTLKNVYVRAIGTTAGIDEFNGPLGDYFDRHYPDFHFGNDSYEQAEIAMLQDAISIALKKGKLKKEDINVYLGGDLNNQVTASNYTAKDFHRPFMAMYGACATMGLVINTASMLIENHSLHNANCFVCSHNATAERQFRYPVEYGVQRKETMTTTATGAVSVILDNNPSSIRIESLTIGRVVDLDQSDPNDMGRAMAPAAFDTLCNHLTDLNRQATYYDLIVTGDLSNYGKTIMKELMKENHISYKEYDDCGSLLYSSDQDVNQGGSGPSCSALVTFGYLYQKMLKHKYKRILVITTGALLSPVMTNQKQSIPCIGHAFSFGGSRIMNYLLAFIFCGLVCVIAQLIYEYTKLTPGHITSMFVVIGAFLDLFHIYDKLVEIFHAGALLPITSFGHSLMHGALAATKEFGFFGLALGVFDLTAAGISSAILFAFLVAVCTKPRS